MSKKRLQNFLTILGNNALPSAISILTFPLIIKSISLKDYGLVSLIGALSAFCYMPVSFCIPSLICRALPGIENRSVLRNTYTLACVLPILFALIVTAPFLFFSGWLSRAFFEGTDIRSLLAVSILGLGIQVAGECLVFRFLIEQRIATYSFLDTLNRCGVQICGAVALFLYGHGRLGLVWAFGVPFIFRLMILITLAWKAWQDDLLGMEKSWVTTAIKLLKDGATLLTGRLLAQGGETLSRMLLSAFSNLDTVGIFSVANRMASIISMFTGAYWTTITPFAARAWNRHEKEKSLALFSYAGGMINLFVAVGFGIGILAGEDGLRILSNLQISREAWVPMIMLIIAYGFSSKASAFIELLFFKGRITSLVKVELIHSFLNLVFVFLLVPKFHVLGASIAVVAANLSQLLYLQINVENEQEKCGRWKEFFMMISITGFSAFGLHWIASFIPFTIISTMVFVFWLMLILTIYQKNLRAGFRIQTEMESCSQDNS